MFSSTLFFLGIDSAFSMVEATSTVITDLDCMKKIPKGFVAFVICLLGFLLSIPFCTNWGYVLFDVIDHYLCTYLLFLCGIFQCFGCGWGFDVESTMNMSENHAKSLKYLTFSFWAYLMIIGLIFVLAESIPWGILALILGIFLICLLPSFLISKLPLMQWYAQIGMCGVRRLGYAMSKMGRNEETKAVQCWEPAFVLYWGISIKYFCPSVLWFLIVQNVKADIDKPYGNYAAHWQALGLIVPLLGLVAFLINICFCLHTEQLDMAEFKERFDIDFKDPWDESAGTEMKSLDAQ